jgi:transcriptional regulator with XRE-family HTH domain
MRSAAGQHSPAGSGGLEGPEFDEFGALLRYYRLAMGLTQEALAERAGLAVRSIPGLEAGEHQPQRDTLQRLTEALGLTPEQRDQLKALSDRQAGRRGGRRFAGDTRVKARYPPNNLPVQLTSSI